MRRHLRARTSRTGLTLRLAAIVLGAATPSAANLYVAPAGNDANTCTAPTAACKTINGAIGKASVGDRIFVAVGSYKGAGSWVVQIPKALTLSGGWDYLFSGRVGYSTIDGEGVRRGIEVFAPGSSVVLEGLFIENGIGTGLMGGGIVNNATLTVNDCIVYNNQNGGIFNTNTLTLNDSLVVGNSNASGGGGIENLAFTTLTINSSTIAGNETTSEGGGIRIGGGGNVTLNDSTVSGNFAQFIGGGIANRVDGTVMLNNVTVADLVEPDRPAARPARLLRRAHTNPFSPGWKSGDRCSRQSWLPSHRSARNAPAAGRQRRRHGPL